MSESTGGDADIQIAWLGGNCPVQSEGTVDGVPFYFRARGSHWSMDIGAHALAGRECWSHDEKFGDWPEAGWMTEEEALGLIRKAAGLWRAARLASEANPTTPEPEWLAQVRALGSRPA